MPVSLPRIVGTVSTVRRPPGRSPVPAGSIVFHPRYRGWLERHGLTSAAAVLDLPGEIVCGHPDRHVARIDVGPPADRRTVFLKREHVVGIRSRVRNKVAGFGPVSRSEREAIVLDQLERLGLPGPQWLAYGEDADGRGFLLVDSVPNARDLRAFAADPSVDAADRRAVAEAIGRSLAELHEAGFGTPELAVKHVLVSAKTLTVTFLDWQSTPTQRPVPTADRIRQLAKLNSTLADATVGPRERSRMLWAYLRVIRMSRGRGEPVRFARLAREIVARTARHLKRSSVRDQSATLAVDQRLVWLAGEAVCVIPELRPAWPEDPTAAPFYPAPDEPRPPAEEWLSFPDGRRSLLTRYRTFDPIGRLIAAVRERPWRSPASRDARLLFHLQRHGIDAPALLAFGQRPTGPRTAESFCLSEPAANAVAVFDRVDDLPARSPERRAILREVGAVLRRLHDAGCRLAHRPPGSAYFTCPADQPVSVAVESTTAVRLVRHVGARQRRHDLVRLCRFVLPGLRNTDYARIVTGYYGRTVRSRTSRKSVLTRVAR